MLFIAFLTLITGTIISLKSRLNTIMFSLGAIVFSVFSLIYILANYFTGHGVDASVIYHLKYGQGAGIVSSIEVIFIGILTLILGIIYTLWSIKILKNKKLKRKKNNKIKVISLLLLLLSFVIHPLTNNILNLNGFYFKKEFIDYKLNFNDLYIKPEISKKEEKTKNLVLIYLESFENLYLNNEIFPNLTPNLNKIKQNSTYFSNIDMSYMSYWTISGMVGSQCGLPIKTNPGEENNTGSLKNGFMPKAYCIGDFLKEDGYNLSYIGGADINFAGKGDFYKTHGFDDVNGRDELLNTISDKSYIHDWGLYDDTMFDKAYEKYNELTQKYDKFALFMLTLDTHGDSGTISKNCNFKYNNSKKSILNAYHCSDYNVSNFINKIKANPKYKDTIIVLVSDHYAMEMNNSIETLKKNQDKRKLTFIILDEENKNFGEIKKLGQTFDIGPTILSKMGYEIKGLGLGRNLFINDSLNFIYKKMDYSKFDKYFSNF